MPPPIQRILVIVTRRIGDVLLTSPLIRAAHTRWPQAQVDVLGFQGTLGVLRGNPHVNELIEVPGGSGWLRSLPLIRRLWRRYDLALVAHYGDRAHLYGWVAAPLRAGLTFAGDPSGRWKRRLLAHAVPVDDDQTHTVLEKLRLLQPWAAAPAAVSIDAPAPAELPPAIAGQLRSGHVVVHLPALYRYKQWPLQHAETLVRGLLADGRQVLLTGGAAPADREKVASVARLAAAPALLDLAGQLDLNQMTTLLAGAALYIGPDTSITHLAAACGVPVLALYGPIDPRLWGPWPRDTPPAVPYQSHALRQRSGHVVVLQGPQECVPCNKAGCERHDDSPSACLETMSGERVLAEARRLLAGSSD